MQGNPAAEQFRRYAVCARFPHNLSSQVPWHKRQPGVYDCHWATDVVRVIVAGELPREVQNAPLHVFSASPELVEFGRKTYRLRSPNTSMVLGSLFNLEGEAIGMSYTMEDFLRDFWKKNFSKLTEEQRRQWAESLSPQELRHMVESLPREELRHLVESLPAKERRGVLESLPPEEQDAVLQALPLEKRLAGISDEQLRQYLDQRAASRPAGARKPKRKK
jgi:hypothetical protein